MEEINNYLRKSERYSIEIVEEKKQQLEYQYIGNIMPYKGHTLFEINPSNLEIKEADFVKNDTYVFGDSLEVKKEVVINKGMVYISALNKKSAIKRYKQGKGSAVITSKSDHISIL